MYDLLPPPEEEHSGDNSDDRSAGGYDDERDRELRRFSRDKDRLLLVCLFEVFLAALHCWNDPFISLFPRRWAHDTVLASELERFEETENFFDVATDVWLVHADVDNDAVRVDDGRATEIVSCVVHVEAVLAGDVGAKITDDREFEVSDTTFTAFGLDPCKVRVDTIDGETDDFAVEFLEAVVVVAEGDNFSGADKSEVERECEQDDPLATVVGEFDVTEFEVGEDSLACEIWGRLADLGDRLGFGLLFFFGG